MLHSYDIMIAAPLFVHRKDLVESSKNMRKSDTEHLKKKTYMLCAAIISFILPVEVIGNVFEIPILLVVHKLTYVILILFIVGAGVKYQHSLGTMVMGSFKGQCKSVVQHIDYRET